MVRSFSGAMWHSCWRFLVSLGFHLRLFHMFSCHNLLPLHQLSAEVWSLGKLLRLIRPFLYVVFAELEAVVAWPPQNYLKECSGHNMQRILERRKLLISTVSQDETSYVLQVNRAIRAGTLFLTLMDVFAWLLRATFVVDNTWVLGSHLTLSRECWESFRFHLEYEYLRTFSDAWMAVLVKLSTIGKVPETELHFWLLPSEMPVWLPVSQSVIHLVVLTHRTTEQ